MITLASDCLLFRLQSGESIPYSPEMISIEFSGGSPEWLDTELVQHAAKAVFHYFKVEEQRKTVTMGEFAEAIEKVLHGVNLAPGGSASSAPTVAESDLARLASASGTGCELFFFPLLRNELRQQMQKSPQILRFKGLRTCVKQLTGLRKWSTRCQEMQQRIVEYLRVCAVAEKHATDFSLVVE